MLALVKADGLWLPPNILRRGLRKVLLLVVDFLYREVRSVLELARLVVCEDNLLEGWWFLILFFPMDGTYLVRDTY